MAEITSRPYQPNQDMCCEACVFGKGKHSPWCPKARPTKAPKHAVRHKD